MVQILVFENEASFTHKAEASLEGEGRCLLLFRLEVVLLKRKVISSQAVCNWALQLPNRIWSHSASPAEEASEWGAECEGIQASPGLSLCQSPHPESFQAEDAWSATGLKATGWGGLNLHGAADPLDRISELGWAHQPQAQLFPLMVAVASVPFIPSHCGYKIPFAALCDKCTSLSGCRDGTLCITTVWYSPWIKQLRKWLW